MSLHLVMLLDFPLGVYSSATIVEHVLKDIREQQPGKTDAQLGIEVKEVTVDKQIDW